MTHAGEVVSAEFHHGRDDPDHGDRIRADCCNSLSGGLRPEIAMGPGRCPRPGPRFPEAISLLRDPQIGEALGDRAQHAVELARLCDREIHVRLGGAVLEQRLIPVDHADRIDPDVVRLGIGAHLLGAMRAASSFVASAASITDWVDDQRFCVFSPSVGRMMTLLRSGAGALNGGTGETVCQAICMPMVTLMFPLGAIASIIELSVVQSLDSVIIEAARAVA